MERNVAMAQDGTRAENCPRMETLSERLTVLANLLELRGDKGHRVVRLAIGELALEQSARAKLRELKEHVGELDAVIARAEICASCDQLVVPVAAVVESLRRVRRSVGFDV